MNLPEFGLEHVGLAADDTAALKNWYVRVFDAEVIFESRETPPAFLVRLPGGMLIEFYPAHHALEGKSNNRSSGLRHLALRVSSIESARRALEVRGVKFNEAPKPAGGGGRVLFFNDPEGNLLHFVERTNCEIDFSVGKRATRPNSKFKAVIFDMDGVIVDSEPLHEAAFRAVFEEIGYATSHGIDFTKYYGRSDRALWIDFIQMNQPRLSLDELSEMKQRIFLEMMRRDEPVFPPVPKLVRKLAEVYPLALASGSYHPTINLVLGMQGLREHFRAIVSVQDVQHGKPAPDVFLRAAELLQVEPQSCCVIEDSAAGIEAAKRAGMTAIAITNSLPAEKLSAADHVVSAYEQIELLLLS